MTLSVLAAPPPPDTQAQTLPTPVLRRVLGPAALTGLGVGGIIGTGIFVMTGIAAHDKAGPAVIVSFLIAALACVCAALCYAELAARVPASGSAYTYASIALGRGFGWLVGWNVILMYAVAAASVAQGWSHYLQALLGAWSLHFPAILGNAPFDLSPQTGRAAASGAWLDLPALLVVFMYTAILVRGVQTSVRVNTALVVLKLAVIGFVIVVGACHIHPANWHPFAPYGWGMLTAHAGGAPVGVLAGAAIAFYAYLGFEAVSVYPEESRHPRRDVPVAIVAAVLICAVLYMAVASVVTGMVPSDKISIQAPVSDAFRQVGMPWAQGLVALGALTGISSVLLVIMLSLPRILMTMGRDKLLPARIFSAIHPRYRTPWRATILNGVVIALLASLLPLRVLADVVTIATLFTFVVVAVAVLLLRRRNPAAPAPFQSPFGPLIPGVTILSCLLLMASVPAVNWLRLAVWIALGAVIYALYGRRQALISSDISSEEN
jgi:APA family basic amino acid/polyamine antiporter